MPKREQVVEKVRSGFAVFCFMIDNYDILFLHNEKVLLKVS